MELFLWLVVYLAFILPVTKCFAIEGGGRYHKVADWVGFGIFWPITVPSVVGGTIVESIAITIPKKIFWLIED